MSTRMRSESWRPGAIAIVAGIALAGTACVRRPQLGADGLPTKPDHAVKILYTGACPTDVDAGPSACDPGRKNCLRAHPKQVVLLESATGSDFTLQLGPTKDALPASSGGKLVLFLDVDVKAGTSKTFPYNVLAKGCPPHDPQIIIDN